MVVYVCMLYVFRIDDVLINDTVFGSTLSVWNLFCKNYSLIFFACFRSLFIFIHVYVVHLHNVFLSILQHFTSAFVGSPAIGTVIRIPHQRESGWIVVKWDTTKTHWYRMGFMNKYDVKFAD